MLRRVHLACVVALALTLPAAAAAQTSPEPKSGSKSNPAGSVNRPNPQRGASGRGRVTMRVAVGEQAPDFELETPEGRSMRLSKLRGNWVMLVFVERRDSLDVLETMARKLGSINVRTVAVCYDKAQSIAHHLSGRDLGLTPLADPTGDIVALYGLLDPVREESEPGFVLVNPRGDVRMALLGTWLPRDDASRLVEFAVTGE